MDMREINQAVIHEFRENDGELSGPMAGAPILLLTTTGRRSGKAHTTPLGFIDAGGRLAVAAANGGADADPHWFLNLVEDHTVTVEVPGARIDARASVVPEAERVLLLQELSESLPGMSDHVDAAQRDVPVVVLSET